MLESFDQGLLHAGLVDLDWSFVVQLGVFLVFFMLLNLFFQ